MENKVDSKTFKATDRYGAEIEFVLMEPGVSESREADIQYNIAYSKCLSNGILPREKMIELMKVHEVWTGENSKEMSNLTKELISLEANLEKTKSTDEGLKIAADMASKRSRLYEIIGIQQGPLSHSCEGISNLVRMESLLASCVYINGTNKRYWASYKDFVSERDDNEKSNVADKAMNLKSTIMDEEMKSILGNSPEQAYVDKVKTLRKKKTATRKKRTQK